jgi:AraC-like DNA-binding protein
MSVVFRADDEPVATRADRWRAMLDETLGPLDPLGVPDHVHVADLGAVRVAELSQREPGGAKRTAGHVRGSTAELYKVDVLARGRGVIEQGGREAVLRPGDLTLVDLSRPARWAMSSVRCVAVVFPPAVLPLSRDELTRGSAVRVPGDKGAGALASAFVRQLAGHFDDRGERNRARLGTAVLDLLSVALADRLDRASDVPPDTRQRALVLRIRGFIEEHLGDLELSPVAVASAHHISLRYLHKLFETEQTTVAAWIRQRRLERCRRDLLDPALRHWPVSAIAARWGLTNAAHFSRLFRDAYGIPPAEYRIAGGRPS